MKTLLSSILFVQVILTGTSEELAANSMAEAQ
jgi:hypothetical protein